MERVEAAEADAGASPGEDGFVVSFSTLLAKVKSACGDSYRLTDTLVFNFDACAEELMLFRNDLSAESMVGRCFRVLPFLNDVEFAPFMKEFDFANVVWFVLKPKQRAEQPRLVLGGDASAAVEEDVDMERETHRTRKNRVHRALRRTQRFLAAAGGED